MEYKILHKNAKKHIDNPGILSDARIIEIVENSRLFIEDIETRFWKETARIEIVFQYGKKTAKNYHWYGVCCPTRYVTRKELTHTLYIFIPSKWVGWQLQDKGTDGFRRNKAYYEIDHNADRKRVEHTLGHELGHIYYPNPNKEYRQKGAYYKDCEQKADDFARLITGDNNE